MAFLNIEDDTKITYLGKDDYIDQTVSRNVSLFNGVLSLFKRTSQLTQNIDKLVVGGKKGPGFKQGE